MLGRPKVREELTEQIVLLAYTPKAEMNVFVIDNYYHVALRNLTELFLHLNN